MRKRKRDYGTYLDEETGETVIVQTTKQAKRAHQKSGKWYKEPTAKELRIWEREAKQKEAAEKAVQREESRKKNAVKRAEKEAKELELKQKEFLAGKISFTQTLAKKDEDQLNLHSWFGGRPQKPKSTRSLSYAAKPINDENKENTSQSRSEVTGDIDATAHRSHSSNLRQRPSHLPSKDGLCASSPSSLLSQFSSLPYDEMMAELMDEKDQSLTAFEQGQHTDQSPAFEDFDIAEDIDADIDARSDDYNEESRRSELNSDGQHEFRIPALPTGTHLNRPPLSPMSKSDVNVRNSQTVNVGSFTKRLEASGIPSFSNSKVANPSTQMVKDLLSGICTQDFNDNELDEDYDDKENRKPATACDAKEGPKSANRSPLKSSVLPSKISVDAQHCTKPFPPLSDSFDGHDYDNIFAELGDTMDDIHADGDSDDEDFDDGGLDDDTLLSLPATQILISNAKRDLSPQPTSVKTNPTPLKTITTSPIADTGINQIPRKAPDIALNCDSFAIDGLSDDDLLQGLKQYEQQSQQASGSKKRKRALPWEKEGWTAATTGGLSQQLVTADSPDNSQKTELLSSQCQ